APAPRTPPSSSFTPDSPIPIENTCDGENTSPPLTWGGVPEGTVELEIYVVNPDASAEGVVRLIIAVRDPGGQAMAIGNGPYGAVQAMNSGGSTGWTGP